MNMQRLFKTTIVIGIAALVGGAYAQGSAGGYGQGSAQGYGQGGSGMAGGGFERKPLAEAGSNTLNRFMNSGATRLNAPTVPGMLQPGRPEDDATASLWDVKSSILTPGERVEYKVDMKKGETVLAGADSDAFDPALELDDPKGAALAKNDDRAEGDQSPFIAYRVPEDGTYKLKVLSYHSVSGGKFTVHIRTLLSYDAPMGRTKHEFHDEFVPRFSRVVFRLVATKGAIYDLRTVQGANNLALIVGPTGVPENDYDQITTPDGTMAFRARAAGDYYLDYVSYNHKECVTDYHEVVSTPAKTTEDTTFDMDGGELRLVTFPVKPNLILHMTTTAPGMVSQWLDAPLGKEPPQAYTGEADTYGRDGSGAWFLTSRDNVLDQVRIFYGDGTAKLAIRSFGKNAKVSVNLSETLPEWNDKDAQKGAIGIGEIKLFVLHSKKSELMKVTTKTDHFQPVLSIFRLNGDLANTLSDRRTHTASDDLYFPDADTFLIRLTCEGYGGSGDFDMNRDSIPATPYTLGTAQTIKLDGTNFGLYSVNLEKGKRYEFVVDRPAQSMRCDLLDEDGEFLVSQAINFDKVSVQYFTARTSGKHRLWLRAGPSTLHFKLEPNVPPTVG